MDPDAIRALARTIYRADKARGIEQRAWLVDGRMSLSQERRLGRADKPACFPTELQWLAWCILEAAGKVTRGLGFCTDCTRAYQRVMRRNGLCEHPLTIMLVTDHSVGRPRRAPPR